MHASLYKYLVNFVKLTVEIFAALLVPHSKYFHYSINVHTSRNFVNLQLITFCDILYTDITVVERYL